MAYFFHKYIKSIQIEKMEVDQLVRDVYAKLQQQKIDSNKKGNFILISSFYKFKVKIYHHIVLKFI